MAGIRMLWDLDREIRTAIKKWLHLHPSTTSGLLYSSAANGGLGVVKLEAQIPTLQLERLVGMLKSDDPRIRSLAKRIVRLEKLWKLWRVISKTKARPPPDLVKAIHDIPKSQLSAKLWRDNERHCWCELKTQGLGAEVFKGDKISTGWLLQLASNRLTESELILALKLRTHTLPTLAMQQRGRQHQPTSAWPAREKRKP